MSGSRGIGCEREAAVSEKTGPNDEAILAAMLAEAEKLCGGNDALMVGQYRHLRERIRALIELRLCASEALPRK